MLAYLYLQCLHFLSFLGELIKLFAVPVVYVALSFFLGRGVAKATRINVVGWATFILLLSLPIGWISGMQIHFSRLCEQNERYVINEKMDNVDGVLTIGLAHQVLLKDIQEDDGFLFYEFDRDNMYTRIDPSRKSEKVAGLRSKFSYEISEPQLISTLFHTYESRLVVRELSTGRVLAEAKDILRGGGLLEPWHRRMIGATFWACGPGITRGGWRGGIVRDRNTEFVRRDREFLRTALIPARSAAKLETTFPEPSRGESSMGYQETLWRLVSEIAKHDGYNTPLIVFKGNVPVDHLHPPAITPAPAPETWGPGESNPREDPDVAVGIFWANVSYVPKESNGLQLVPNIRVIQQRGKVIIKAVPVADRNIALNTGTLDYRIRIQTDMNQFVRAALEPVSMNTESKLNGVT